MSEFQQTIFIGITTNDNSCYSNCKDEGVNEHYQHIQVVQNVSAKKKKSNQKEKVISVSQIIKITRIFAG